MTNEKWLEWQTIFHLLPVFTVHNSNATRANTNTNILNWPKILFGTRNMIPLLFRTVFINFILKWRVRKNCDWNLLRGVRNRTRAPFHLIFTFNKLMSTHFVTNPIYFYFFRLPIYFFLLHFLNKFSFSVSITGCWNATIFLT